MRSGAVKRESEKRRLFFEEAFIKECFFLFSVGWEKLKFVHEELEGQGWGNKTQSNPSFDKILRE